jgi:hypothetical protein
MIQYHTCIGLTALLLAAKSAGCMSQYIRAFSVKSVKGHRKTSVSFPTALLDEGQKLASK